MTTEEEFEEFVARNRDLIERMIEMQKGTTAAYVDAEREMARQAYRHMRDVTDSSRVRAEELARSAYSAFTDPEVQRHFVNMGLEFFMGMSALMERAPMPDHLRDGFRDTERTVMSAACRARECPRQDDAPKRVEIVSDDRRDEGDVFKGCEERRCPSARRPWRWPGPPWRRRRPGAGPLPSRGTPASPRRRGLS